MLRRHPDRHRVVVAEPAPVSLLRERWQRSGGADSTQGLAEFVVRQAQLALERAERRLRGARYKVPRFVHEEILARPGFRAGLARLARETAKTEAAVAKQAVGYLREIAATLSLAEALAPGEPAAEPEADERSLAVAKLAFEVSVRINRVTPITPASLVTLALLGADRALTIEETVTVLRNWIEYVRRRDLPTSEELRLDTPDGVRVALQAPVASGVLTCFAEGPEPVYAIGDDQHLAVAYYRNTIVHFFVNSAIAELALLRAAEAEVAGHAEAFWREALGLRNLFKFEFFFAEKDEALVFAVSASQ